MQRNSVDRTQNYILARQQNPAWQLLAGRRAPLVLGCLQTLFEASQDGVDEADAQQALTALLRAHGGKSDFDIEGDIDAMARKELRTWIRRALIVEREGRIYATDALESALRFVDGLGNRVMTSTASRLAIVQREIERLEARLNPDPQSRVNHLRQQITALQLELEAAEAGRVDIAEPQEAAEGARELYALATSLRAASGVWKTLGAKRISGCARPSCPRANTAARWWTPFSTATMNCWKHQRAACSTRSTSNFSRRWNSKR